MAEEKKDETTSEAPESTEEKKEETKTEEPQEEKKIWEVVAADGTVVTTSFRDSNASLVMLAVLGLLVLISVVLIAAIGMKR